MPSSKARSAKQQDILSVAQKNFGYKELWRKTAEAVMRSLAEEGTEALYCHAGLKAEQQEQRQQVNKKRLRQMCEYADTGSCRREHLLRYFGDDFYGLCRNYDDCEAASLGLAIDLSMGTRRKVA